jgi:hypothetical protein
LAVLELASSSVALAESSELQAIQKEKRTINAVRNVGDFMI